MEEGHTASCSYSSLTGLPFGKGCRVGNIEVALVAYHPCTVGECIVVEVEEVASDIGVSWVDWQGIDGGKGTWACLARVDSWLTQAVQHYYE